MSLTFEASINSCHSLVSCAMRSFFYYASSTTCYFFPGHFLWEISKSQTRAFKSTEVIICWEEVSSTTESYHHTYFHHMVTLTLWDVYDILKASNKNRWVITNWSFSIWKPYRVNGILKYLILLYFFFNWSLEKLILWRYNVLSCEVLKNFQCYIRVQHVKFVDCVLWLRALSLLLSVVSFWKL